MSLLSVVCNFQRFECHIPHCLWFHFLAFFSANAAAQALTKFSPRVTNEAVQKAAGALKGCDHCRATNVSVKLDARQKKLKFLILPTTTIGSFPQTMELRKDL
ncbi:5-methyltetrahydropteroyltriglutamate--homocysteine S-methyltransferase [Sarracenia purpurea var. burkii]